MRNHQILGIIHQIIIEDNIQIQCPGSPVKLTFSSFYLLNTVQLL